MKRIEFLLQITRISKSPVLNPFTMLSSLLLVFCLHSCNGLICPHDPVEPCFRPFSMGLVNGNGVNLLNNSEDIYYWEKVKVYNSEGEELLGVESTYNRFNWTPIEIEDCENIENMLNYRYFIHFDETDIDTVDFVYDLKSLKCERVGIAYQEIYYNDSLHYQSDLDRDLTYLQVEKSN